MKPLKFNFDTGEEIANEQNKKNFGRAENDGNFIVAKFIAKLGYDAFIFYREFSSSGDQLSIQCIIRHDPLNRSYTFIKSTDDVLYNCLSEWINRNAQEREAEERRVLAEKFIAAK